MTIQKHQCTVAVVGTGAGGAVAGAVLAEAGVDTIMLEWGRRHEAHEHSDVVDSMARMYFGGGATMALGRPPIIVPLGRAVGGTTVVNSATCFRAPRDKVAAWGGPSHDEMEPFFGEVERRISAVPLDEELLGVNARVVRRGADRLGIAVKPLTHNVRACKGRGRCAFGCPENAKQSMDLAFVPDAVKSGARLMPSHRVDGFLFEGRRIAGLRGRCDAGRFEIRAEIVVLAMGAMFTPAFLLRQGVGNGSRRVGRNLSIHPAVRVVAQFDEHVDGFQGVPQGFYIDHWQDRGIMIEGIFTPPGPLLASLPGAGPEFKALAASYRHLAAAGVMVSDTATGRVWPGRLGTPFIAAYQIAPGDVLSLRFGIARLCELYMAAGARRVFTGIAPLPVVDDALAVARLETLAVKPTDFELLAFHPIGTCAMGADPAVSVVNTDLRIHDADNVYIMDASVIPRPLGVNPQVTIMALAMRAAGRLAARLNREN